MSKRFQCEGVVSANMLCESWVAIDRTTGGKCFVKIALASGSVSKSVAGAILAKSFQNQRKLKTSKVLTAISKSSEDGTLFIKYPYLDQPVWRLLTPDLFWKHSKDMLLDFCVTVDYLHMLDLVHCDLKLSNFLVCTNRSRPALVLIDLDYLSADGSSPEAKVFGTHEHIAPEILANDRIWCRSDNYSLGVLLAKCLNWQDTLPDSSKDPNSVDTDALGRLAESLKQTDPVHRPRYATEALHREGIIDDACYQQSQKVLMSMMMVASYRNPAVRRSVDGGLLRRSILTQNKILGLGAELVDDLVAAYKRCRPGTFRLFRELIEVASIERFGDYWHVALTDTQLKSLYASLRKILLPSSESAESESRADRRATLLREVSKYREAGQIQKAFLCLSDALDSVPSEGASASTDERNDILLELGRLACSLSRLNEALAYYNQLLSGLESDHPQYLEILYETTVLTSRLSDTDQMMTNAELGQTLAKSCGNTDYELRFARLKAWTLAATGNNQQALETLDEIQKVAADSDHADVLALVLYTRGVIEWRKGDYALAIRYLTEGLTLAKSNNLYSEARPIVITLALLHQEIAEYEKVVKFGKAAIQSAIKPADKLRLPAVFLSLSFAYMRLGEYNKAEYWLQRYLNVGYLAYNRHHLSLYYHAYGLLKSNSGEFREANEYLQRALELGSSQGSQRHLGKVYQTMAEVALFQGNKAMCRSRPNLPGVYSNVSVTKLRLLKSRALRYSSTSATEVPIDTRSWRTFLSHLRSITANTMRQGACFAY